MEDNAITDTARATSGPNLVGFPYPVAVVDGITVAVVAACASTDAIDDDVVAGGCHGVEVAYVHQT